LVLLMGFLRRIRIGLLTECREPQALHSRGMEFEHRGG
jgi:hypothetical protein